MLHYELRVPQDLADRAEIARRRLIRAYDDEDDVQLEAVARELLAIYPDSFLAFELRGRVAEKWGKLNEALPAYERAQALLRDRRDRLFLEHNSAEMARLTLEGLGGEVERVRSQRK